MAWATWIALEQRQRCRATGSSRDLDKLGEQHDQQRLDLVLVARAVVGQLTVQTRHLAIGGDQFVGHIAPPRLAAQQQARERGRIQAIRLRTQAALLRELVRLTRMQQTQGAALLAAKLGQVFAVAPAPRPPHPPPPPPPPPLPPSP